AVPEIRLRGRGAAVGAVQEVLRLRRRGDHVAMADPAGGSAVTGAQLWRGVIEEYRDRLPVTADTSLDVWLKYEGGNPTGSFKDRGMTLAISKAIEEGSKAVVCASTGN